MRELHCYKEAWTVFLALAAPLSADEIRFDGVLEWRKWQLPGAVELSPEGRIQPVKVRKDINAALDAPAFGGGLREAGSNAREAFRVMDGDPTTGWGPDLNASREDWFVEIDLGRGVSARRVHLLFDEEALPFERFDLLFSTGEQQLDKVGNALEGSLVFRTRERFKENEAHRVTLELDPSVHPPFQVVRFETFLPVAKARLMEVVVEAFGDNLSLGLLERGGKVEIVVDLDRLAEFQPLDNVRTVVDGKLNTRWSLARTLIGSVSIWSSITLDLGAVYWVDWVRLISRVVPTPNFFFQNTYEVLTSDGSLAPDGTFVWHKQFSGVGTDTNRRQGLADHPIASSPARHVRIAWIAWQPNCGVDGCPRAAGRQSHGITEELQVYGEGYPQAVQLRSPLLDLGDDKNLSAVIWEADTPAGTRLEIRSRTGNEVVDRYTFHDKDLKEITEQRYNKLIDFFKGPIDTSLVAGADWSPWSRLYAFSGEAFQSPSPRRFAELEVRLISDRPEAAVTLDALSLQFSAPLARRLIGEIYPVSVRPGELTHFRYFVRAVQSTGYDRVVLEASVPMTFESAFVAGEPVAVTVDTLESGLGLNFPRRIFGGQEVEIGFESSVFLQGTRFSAFVEDRGRSEPVRQRVEAGDASDEVASSTDVVRLPVGGPLLEGVSVSSPVVTPNGDGINDVLSVGVDVVNVLSSRPLRMRVYDLSGRRLWEQQEEGVAGRRQFVWAGRDESGQVLPPGLYVVELVLEGDARQTSVRRIVALAY